MGTHRGGSRKSLRLGVTVLIVAVAVSIASTGRNDATSAATRLPRKVRSRDEISVLSRFPAGPSMETEFKPDRTYV